LFFAPQILVFSQVSLFFRLFSPPCLRFFAFLALKTNDFLLFSLFSPFLPIISGRRLHFFLPGQGSLPKMLHGRTNYNNKQLIRIIFSPEHPYTQQILMHPIYFASIASSPSLFRLPILVLLRFRYYIHNIYIYIDIKIAPPSPTYLQQVSRFSVFPGLPLLVLDKAK
jgi:hypothetical protein